MKTIAVVGNPNVGKSSWINALTKSELAVGNYSGISVDIQPTYCTWQKERYALVDLPGLYGLHQANREEKIAADYLRQEKVDAIVCIADVTNLKRSLPLMLEIRELQIPMMIVLNFKDDAVKQGIVIHIQDLQHRLHMQILLCSLSRKDDIIAVWQGIANTAQMDASIYRHPLLLPSSLEKQFLQVFAALPTYLTQAQKARSAIQYCEGKLDDALLSCHFGQLKIDQEAFYAHQNTLIQSLLRHVEQIPHRRLLLTRSVDHILLHRIFAIPLFFAGMFVFFLTVFVFSQPLTQWMDGFINDYLIYYLMKCLYFLPVSLTQLIEHGILRGIGGVLLFVPMLGVLFFLLAFLEESGYFARVAFMFDRIMRPFRLSGKSFVAMIMGFGCNVPAIYATRTLFDRHSRIVTALIIPLMSCGARLPIYMMFGMAFFPNKLPVLVFSLYGISLLTAFTCAFILSRCIPQTEQTLFTIELPPYHMPAIRLLVHKMMVEVRAFIKKTIRIVCLAMIVLFLLTHYPSGTFSDSYLARFANRIAFLFEPLGFGNRTELLAALPGGLIAKENIIGFLSQVYIGKEELMHSDFLSASKEQLHKLWQALLLQEQEKSNSHLTHALFALWDTPDRQLRAFSYLVYILLMIPCVMTVKSIYHEFGWRWMLLSLVMMSILPYVLSFLIFQGGQVFFLR